MSKAFKKESPSYKATQPETPYLRAKKEWDDRIGNAVVQTANWRLTAILALILSLILIVLLLLCVTSRKSKVFVAEVAASGQVVNIKPLVTTYDPTLAQKKYFITRFIKSIRSLPLDPVVAKKNLLSAYNFLTQRSSQQLNSYFRKHNPLQLLGKETITVKILDINPISKNTFEVSWSETHTDLNGITSTSKKFSGVFTITIKQPTTDKEILHNPLGIYIVDFSISTRDANNEK
jgi:type IV secretion system protein TrbF